MENNLYNSKDDEKFVKLIEDLKNLPRVTTEDNFEYNLMVKIRNKNFNLNTPEKGFFFSRPIVPAAAVVFSTILLFFILSDSSVNIENPFLAAPQVRKDYSIAKTDTIVLSKHEAVAQNNEAIAVEGEESNIVPTNNLVRVVVESSDAVTVEEVNLPFDDSNSLDLDTYVAGNEVQSSSNLRGRLVSGGSQPTQFNGFLVKERPSQTVLESHKEMVDSLKKVSKSDKK